MKNERRKTKNVRSHQICPSQCYRIKFPTAIYTLKTEPALLDRKAGLQQLFVSAISKQPITQRIKSLLTITKGSIIFFHRLKIGLRVVTRWTLTRSLGTLYNETTIAALPFDRFSPFENFFLLHPLQ